MNDVSLIVYPAPDVDAAKRFFRELTGTEPYVDSPQYIGFKSGNMEIGLVPNGHKPETGALAYWNVDDISARVKELVAAGGTIAQEIRDVGYGMLVASVKDANGSTVGLRQFPKKN